MLSHWSLHVVEGQEVVLAGLTLLHRLARAALPRRQAQAVHLLPQAQAVHLLGGQRCEYLAPRNMRL